MSASAVCHQFRAPAGTGRVRRAVNRDARGAKRVAIRAAPQTSAASTVSPRKVLIVNTNGGGHANIGFWLAKTLVQQGHQVTLNVVGDKDDKKMQKPPFSYFPELTSLGVRTTWSDPCDLASKASGEKFDVVVDNNGKDLASVGPVADFAEAAGAKQFFFVSSAGMYKPTNTPPHLEGDAVKETAGHAVVEQMLFKKPFAASCFRPQYFTGYGNNKDCEEWFFDRIVRGRPVPVPGSGDQLSVVAHCEDVATMMAAAVGCDAAGGQIFNAVTTKAVTLNGMVEICAKAAGVEPRIVNYDPKNVPDGVEVKKAFPFRPIHFYSYPAKALEVLDWQPKHDLLTDMQERFAFYKASGRGDKEMTFETDDKILNHAR